MYWQSRRHEGSDASAVSIFIVAKRHRPGKSGLEREDKGNKDIVYICP